MDLENCQIWHIFYDIFHCLGSSFIILLFMSQKVQSDWKFDVQSSLCLGWNCKEQKITTGIVPLKVIFKATEELTWVFVCVALQAIIYYSTMWGLRAWIWSQYRLGQTIHLEHKNDTDTNILASLWYIYSNRETFIKLSQEGHRV